MENYNRYYDQQSSQDYDQYNLWQNSRFHNGFHLQTQWGEDSAPSQELETSSDDEKSGGEEKTAGKRDEKNWRRIITKAELLEDPEQYCRMVFGEKEEQVETQPQPQDSTSTLQTQQEQGYDWTQTHWRKGNEELPESSIHIHNNTEHSSKETEVANLNSNSIETEVIVSDPAETDGLMLYNMNVNHVQRRIMKAVAQPIAISKATYMMERMGWKGGPLGRRSDGIAEPIAPDATYITKKGFGHEDPPLPKRVPKKRDPPPNKKAKMTRKETKAVQKEKQELAKKKNAELLTTNSLIEILEFVTNDREIEISFDKKLSGMDRKIIHNTVQFITDGTQDLETINFDNPHHMQLLERIDECNNYNLVTESDGERKQRQLSLFKEAKDHTYLITPDDLLPQDEQPDLTNDETELKTDTSENTTKNTSDKSKKSIQSHEKNIEIDKAKIDATDSIEENTNPFLKSIERNLQNSTNENCMETSSTHSKENTKGENSVNVNKTNETNIEKQELDYEIVEKNVTEIIKEYFTEFLDEEIYAEFRFLGPFSAEEIEKINAFINHVHNCVYNGEAGEGYTEILEKINAEEKYYYEVKEDCNGSVVIYKCKTEDINT